jgi:putative component of toxin-antitoxin plasmid stabilization module
MAEIVEKFDAKTDNGKVYRIVVRQSRVDMGSLDDPHASKPGLREFRTDDGGPVSMKDEQTFEIVRTGEIARRV